MKLNLKYGRGMVQADFRAPRRFAELKPKFIATLQKPENLVSQALAHPIGCHDFDYVFRGASSVLIIVPDEAQRVGGGVFLPIVLERLYRLGLSSRDITILVAGVWGARRNGIPQLLGARSSRHGHPRIVYHDARDAKSMEYIGRTRRNTPIFVNRLLLDFDRVLVCGGVNHHPFAGYDGGPSLVVPDCAGAETITRLSALTLDPFSPRLHPHCRGGVIEGNPLQEDMREAFRFLTIDFLLHTILNDCNQVIGAVGGEPLQAYAACCHRIDDIYRVPVAQLADLVLVSGGGYPHDRDYDTAHRALHHAIQAVRPGGVVILAAQCLEGAGAAQLATWLNEKDLSRLHEQLQRQYHPTGALAMSTRQKAGHARIIFISNLDSALVTALGFHSAPTLSEALQLAYAWLPNIDNCYLLPNGSNTIPFLV